MQRILIDAPRYESAAGKEKKKEIDINDEDFAEVLKGIDFSHLK